MKRIGIQLLGFMFICASLALSVYAAPAPAPGDLDSSDEPVSETIRKIRSAPRGSDQRNQLQRRLRRQKVKSAQELDALIEAAKDDEIAGAALVPIEGVDGSANSDVKKKMVDLIDVDDDSKDLRVLRTVLRTTSKHRFPGTHQKVKDRLNREPKTRLREPNDLKRGWADNWRKGKRIVRVQELARTLVALDDKESIPQLFELDEVLATGSAGSMLTPLGKEALVYAASQYEKEDGLRKEGCLAVVAMSSSVDSIPELRKIARSKNAALRRAALGALIRAKVPDLSDFLTAAKADEDESVRKLARNESFRIDPLSNREEIERLLRSPDSREQLAILQLLAGSPPKGMEDTLEKFIQQDEIANPGNPMMRFYAAHTIWKLTGRKIEYSRGAATYKPYPWDDPSNK